MSVKLFKSLSVSAAFGIWVCTVCLEVNKRTQELIQSDPHQAPNTNTFKQSQNEQMASRVGGSLSTICETLHNS